MSGPQPYACDLQDCPHTPATCKQAALEARVDAALELIRVEVLRAMFKHPVGMHTSHEAFGVIFEEFNIEFAEAMKANDTGAQILEMIQTGAMTVRALLDVYHVGK